MVPLWLTEILWEATPLRRLLFITKGGCLIRGKYCIVFCRIFFSLDKDSFIYKVWCNSTTFTNHQCITLTMTFTFNFSFSGSVIITTTITGNTTTVQQIIDGVCDSISTGTTFTYNGQTFTLSSYLTIDNSTYYGVSCGASSVSCIINKHVDII